MFAYATMISVTDIEAEQESMNYRGDTHADSLIENGKQQSKTYSFEYDASFEIAAAPYEIYQWQEVNGEKRYRTDTILLGCWRD
jgi:hypothetical protein